jgi:hypothetical protein
MNVLMNSFTVDQALYGYQDGHRLIASSKKLSSEDDKTLLVMSDIATEYTSVSESGYITGFPLYDSGCYALCRTWPAIEMPRPGCVWTHVLLIDFTNLATAINPCSILHAFSYPNSVSRPIYSTKKTLRMEETDAPEIFNSAKNLLREIIYNTYERPSDTVYLNEAAHASLDKILLSIWLQQWPRLRRSFRFCTLASLKHSDQMLKFDLCVLSPNEWKSVHQTATVPADVPWVEQGVDDITNIDFEFRNFLNRAGAEFQSGRAAYKWLCELYIDLRRNDPVALTHAVSVFEEFKVDQEMPFMRGQIAEKALEYFSMLSNSVKKFVFSNIKFLTLDQISPHFNSFILDQSLRQHGVLKDMLVQSKILNELFYKNANSFSISDILSLEDKDLVPIILDARPSLLHSAEFWRNTTQLDEVMLIRRDGLKDDLIFEAIVLSGRMEIPSRYGNQFSPIGMLPRLFTMICEGHSFSNYESIYKWWLMTLSHDGRILGDVISSSKICDKCLWLITEVFPPFFIPVQEEGDPVWHGVRKSSITTKKSRRGRESVSFWMIGRAFRRKSIHSTLIIAAFFEEVYEKLGEKDLPEKNFELFNDNVTKYWWISSWDHCYRMRVAVVEMFVDSYQDVESFLRLGSDEVFALLLEIANWNREGKAFLKKIVGETFYEASLNHRQSIVKNFLK